MSKFGDMTIGDCLKRLAGHPLEVEWAHQTGSKTMLSHAYRVGCEPNALPICGSGTIWRCTTLSSTATRRKYRLARCRDCQKIVGA